MYPITTKYKLYTGCFFLKASSSFNDKHGHLHNLVLKINSDMILDTLHMNNNYLKHIGYTYVYWKTSFHVGTSHLL